MAPDLPDKLLGIDLDEAQSTRETDRSDDDDVDEEHIRVVRFLVGDHRLAVPVDDVRTTMDVPGDLTEVPRTPEAVEGLTDLRGEITAVIDPTVHFPTETAGSEREQLLVFDRSSEGQPAAIRVDEIQQVASIPERDVLDADEATKRDLSADALEHPLVQSLVVQEHRRSRRFGSAVVSPTAADESETEITATDDESGQTDDSVSRGEPTGPQTVIEVTPVIDTDQLLAAAGPTVHSR
ncbi:chemotaxis protein CheW [Natronolimnobius sp. AArcel1]|uniref:chemotaxis protein CheW n=1 Tax=Natronolimnobius sp. AArcel1 TaxID=1679093 RepID=UPI0013ED1E80|nr:chemotaxis protein CheW [Natronolimnobius sp. AArcel1]NGM67524.1 chemotaxis protein CheW [Natronolimnobius sp. AArcel1]